MSSSFYSECVCVCMRMSVYMCAYVWARMCAHEYGSQRWMSLEANLQSLSPLFVETVFLTDFGAHRFKQTGQPQGSSCHLS